MTAAFNTITKVLARRFNLNPDELMDNFSLAKPSDLDDIISLRRRVLGEQIYWDDQQYVQWRYFIDESPCNYWTFKINGKLLAGIGVEHRTLQLGGRQQETIKGMDVMVSPELDGMGVGAWMNLVLQQKYPCMLALGANQNSRSMLKKIFDPVTNRLTFKWVANISPFLPEKLPRPIGAVAAYLYRTMVTLWLLVRFPLQKQGHQVELSSLADLPESLFSVAKSKGTAYWQRTRDYWRWRYELSPRAEFKCYVDRCNDNVQGAMISYIDTHDACRKRGFILDWYFAGHLVPNSAEKKQSYKILLVETLRQFIREGVDIVQISGSDMDSIQVMKQLGFFEDDEDNPVFLKCADNVVVESPLESIQWCFTIGDTDRI